MRTNRPRSRQNLRRVLFQSLRAGPADQRQSRVSTFERLEERCLLAVGVGADEPPYGPLPANWSGAYAKDATTIAEVLSSQHLMFGSGQSEDLQVQAVANGAALEQITTWSAADLRQHVAATTGPEHASSASGTLTAQASLQSEQWSSARAASSDLPPVELAHQLGFRLDVSATADSAAISLPAAIDESQAKTPPANVIRVDTTSASGAATPTGSENLADGGSSGGDAQPWHPLGGEVGPADTTVALVATGFESSEGFSPGFISFQNDWGYFQAGATQPTIATAHPQNGSQHLRLAKDPGFPTDTTIGGVTPSLGTQPAGKYTVSVDVAISGLGGADYHVLLMSPSQGETTAWVDFNYLGHIKVVHDLGAGLIDVDTNVDWTVGSYSPLQIQVDATANTTKYYYGGSLIYTDVVWGGTSVEQVRLLSDNWNVGDVGDFDNLRIERVEPGTPQLTGVKPANWNDFIPVDVVTHAGSDAHLYAGPFYDNQTLYYNWMLSNEGTATAGSYTVRAEITGTGGGVKQWTDWTTEPDYSMWPTNDSAIGPLAAGTHTIKIWLDFDDVASELDELDNYYERTITVLPAGTPAAQPAAVGPLGVSAGASWFQVNDQISTFGGEKSYSANLTAGQYLSAAVQTAESGGARLGTATEVTIPDNGTAAVSSVTVNNSLIINDLDVLLFIDHLNVSDLDVFLVSPGGTSIALSTDNGGTGNHYWNTTLDDEALPAITDAAALAPFYGRYRPESPLSVLDATDAQGTWQLRVVDDKLGGGPAGIIKGWGLRINNGLDATLTITGPNGQLAYNEEAISSILDPAVADLVVPASGTYTFKVGNENGNVGQYKIEAGIFEASMPTEGTGVTNLDPLRAANRNIAVRAAGNGVGGSDDYAITLNASESVTVGATTPGGFFGPYVTVTGPNGFDAGLPYAGPDFDTVELFTAPTTGVYSINVRYNGTADYTNVLSTGTYVLTVAISDTTPNDSRADARPISPFSYTAPMDTTSVYYGVPGKEGIWRGEINPSGEADYFHLGQLTQGELIRLVAQREGSSQVYPLMFLINSADLVINWGRPFRSGALNGVSFFESVIPQTGDYNAVVVGDATVAGGTTLSGGAYDLFYAGFGNVEDSYEQNDNQAQVDAATAGAANSPNLGAVGNVTVIPNLAVMEDSEDWFRFQTATTGGRNDNARILFTHSRGNLNLDLLDASGTLLRRSQGLTDNEQVSLQGLPPGTYYARIWGLNGAHNPEYDLRLQTGAPAARLTSAPFTTDTAYTLQYAIGSTPGTSTQTLAMGDNELIVTAPSGGANPFELVFDVTRVGSMADQQQSQYDLLGNLSRQTDALGRDTVYEFDPLGQLTYVDGPQTGDASAFSYDANGNLVQLVDASAGTTGYTYDELDRLTQITMPNGLGTVKYEYDGAGQVTKLTYPDTTFVSYAYDLAGRLASVTDGTAVTTYSYNAAGQLATMVQPNGVTGAYTFDAYGRLTGLSYTKDAVVVTAFAYTLDANSNRTQMVVTRPSGSATYGYAYDTLDRLVQATYPDGSVVTYAYDANGNRLSTSTDPDGAGPQAAVVENYQYGEDNRLLRITGAGNSLVKQFFYDPRGNVVMLVTPTETTRYEYDYRNLLTSVEDGTNRIEYIYDGRGDRVAQSVNGVRTNYVNDPNQSYTQVLAELNGSGVQQARYDYGLGRIAGLLPGQASPVYYVTDALGSTTDLTDRTGAALKSYSYDAFGSLRPTSPAGGSGTLANNFLFTGENVDPNTGLDYLRARYYAPTTGRFMSKDPAGFTDAANPYQYAALNPVLATDPSGRLLIFGLPAAAWLWATVSANVGVWSYYGTSRSGITLEGAAGAALSSGIGSFGRWYSAGATFVNNLVQGKPLDRALFNAGVSYASSKYITSRAETLGQKITLGIPSSLLKNTISNIYDEGRKSALSAASNLYSSLSRGGVLLNKAADFVGDLKQITGATVDPATGQVVLLGTQTGTVQGLRLDDFVSAVRSIYGSAEDPGVTIDPQLGHEGDTSYSQLVHLFGGLEDTDMGYVVFEADRVMKCLNSGADSNTWQPVHSDVPGYKSLLDRWFERTIAERGTNREGQSRFWWVPNDVKLVRSDDGQSFVFDKAAVKLMTEDMMVGNGATDPDAQALADWYNDNFDALAAEAYPYPSSPGYEHSFQRLEQVARAVAFARFLYDNNIPVDFSWMQDYQVPFVDTPDTTRTVYNTRTGSYPVSGGTVTVTITITGGVTMDTPNTYLAGTPGLQATVLGTRPSEVDQQWTTTVNGQTQTAVALSMDTSFVDGLQQRADTDLSYKTPGDIPLELTRYYNSTKPLAGSFGYAWEFVPADMEFTRPEFYTSYYAKQPSPYVFLNGLHADEIRIQDRVSGRVLTFESSFDFRYGSGVNFGLNANGVPDFIAGGSEQPDGSTLTQTPGTLNYTLTRPDGSMQIFDHEGRLLQVLDARSRSVNYTYTNGRVTSISDSLGQAITLAYDGQGRVTQATGLGGETVAYTYDGLGNLAQADRVRNGDHLKYSYTYNADVINLDDDHLIATVTTPDRVVQSSTLSDIFGRATVQTDSRGNQYRNTFDPQTRTTVTTDTTNDKTTVQQTDALGRPIVFTDQLGRKTQYYYDVVRLVGTQYPGGWTYVQYTDGTNRQPSLVKLPDPNRPWIYYEYDANGNVTLIDDVVRGGDADQDGIDDNPQRFEYDDHNNQTRATDARGLVTSHTYNDKNQRTSMTRGFGTPRAATASWEYDAAGRVTRATDAAGRVTTYTYDALGNLLTQTAAPGTAAQTVTQNTYDLFSRVATQQDGLGRTTVYAYNGQDQVVSTTLQGTPALSSTSQYDVVSGRKTQDADLNGKVTTYTYNDITGDLIAQTESPSTADQSTTQMTYDRFGNLERVIDPVGNVTLFEYDDLQRLVHKLSLGSTPRVLTAVGTNADIVIDFSEPINAALIDNGQDVFVKNSQGQAITGTVTIATDGLTLTWVAATHPLPTDTYTVTLKASAVGQFTTLDGRLLDGEFLGLLPSGNNVAGGDFMYPWFVDDHGNDAAHATSVAIPSSTAGNLDFAGDPDWFQIDAQAGNRLRFEVVLGNQVDSLSDSLLELYDLDGHTLLANNDDIDTTKSQYGSRIDWEVPRTGTYYLRVTGFNDVRTGRYQLDVSRLADDHSDTPGKATVIVVPSVTPGMLEVATDADVFSFAAVAGQEYRITTILGSLSNSVLTLIGPDPDQTTVLTSNNDYYSGDRAAYLYWTAPSAGTYYAKVTSYNGAYFGGYELAVSIDDHGDWWGDATAVTVGTPGTGSLEVKYDPDWFQFTAHANQLYRLEAVPGTLPDTFLALFDANGTIASNDDYEGPGSRLYWTAPANLPPAGQTYYLKVTGKGGSGTYTVAATAIVDDYGNDAAGATTVLVPSSTAGEIQWPGDTSVSRAADVDVFRFAATGGLRYRLETSLGTLADSVVRLYDTNGTTQLLENDDFQGTRSRIEWRAPASGNYFVEVLGANGTRTGTYQFSTLALEDNAPTASLENPGTTMLVLVNPGYIDIRWTDTGLGIDTTTIDPSDITVTGVTVTGVTNSPDGISHYTYSGQLPDATITVTASALHVADLAGNWNVETAWTFEFDGLVPTVQIVPVSPDPRGESVSEMVFVFSEIVSGFNLGDLRLTRDNGANLLTGAQTLTTTDEITYRLGNLAGLTATLGTYALTLDADVSGIVDRAARPLGADASETWVGLPLGQINGVKYHDLNANGVQDAGEPALPGWTIYLDLNNDRNRDSGEPQTVTDATGAYQFANLQPGTYTVAELGQSGWVRTTPGSGSGAVPAGLDGFGPIALTTTDSSEPVRLWDGAVAAQGGYEGFVTQAPAALMNLDDFRNDSRFAGITGRGYTVVVLDTGVDLNHPFFGPDADGNGWADRIVYAYDFADGDADASDVNGHGSNVTSIIASQDKTYPGIAPAAGIIHLKVFKNDGSGTFGYIESALKWVVAHAAEYNIVSVNMSLGDSGNYNTPQTRYGINDEMAALVALGVIPVVAAGNDYFTFQTAGVSYPAADPNALGVGAVWAANFGGPWTFASGAKDFTTGADRITSFSQRDPALTEIFAPGARITGAGATGGTVTMQGTSQAAPQIAGIAALAQQLAAQTLGRRLTFTEFVSVLRSSAATIHDGDDEDDNVTNTGLDFRRVDVAAMGEAILALAHPAPGAHEVQIVLGSVINQVNFGNVRMDGWALAAGQAGALPDDATEDVTVDARGNRYFVGNRHYVGDSGSNPGSAAAFVARYTPGGQLSWQHEYAGTADVRARRIAADEAGNVYVLGSFQGTVDLDPTATHAGNIDVLTSVGSYDVFLLKLNSAGQFQWARRFGNSAAIWDRGTGLTLDSAGNVYVTGEFGGTTDFDPLQTHAGNTDLRTSRGSGDIYAAKYTAAGDFAWVWTAGGTGSDSGIALTIDSRGRVHVSAIFEGAVDFNGDGSTDRTSQGSSDVALLELDATGQLVRLDTLGGTGFDQVTAIRVDEWGNRYVSGLFQSTVDFDPTAAGVQTRTAAGSFDIFVLRLGPTGSFDWVRQIGGTLDDRATDLQLDSQGDVLVSGFFNGTVDFQEAVPGRARLTSRGVDGFLLDLNAAGEFRWVRTVSSAGDDQANALASGSAGSVALAGFFSDTIQLDTGEGITTLNTAGGKDALVTNLPVPTASMAPTTIDLAPISDGGMSSTDRLTKLDNSQAGYRLQFVVQATIPGATVSLYADGTFLGSAAVSGYQTTVLTNGTVDLLDGVHLITSRQTEPGRAASADSTATTITVDTASPAVASVAVSDALISDSDTGSGKAFTVTVEFSELMDISVQPVLSFSPSHASTLSNPAPVWTDGDTLTVTYQVSDQNVDVRNIQIDVSGAKDVAGNAQLDYTPENEFGIDTLNPTVASLTPADNATGVAVTANLVITFDENIRKGVAGSVVIKKASDNSIVETVVVSGARVSVSGATATIDPATTLTESTEYYVLVDAGAFEDTAGNPFASISGPTAWNFNANLIVTSLTPTSTGFYIRFNRDLAVGVLNLYDQGAVLGLADLTLTGAVVGDIQGSLVIGPDRREATFIKTNTESDLTIPGLLQPDQYTVTLKSGATAFCDTSGGLLDGDGNGTPGGDYVGNFTVAAFPANAVTVSLPNVTRGYGQPVNLPADNLTAGLPLTISNGLGVTRVELAVQYDSSLLAISAFALAPAVPSGAAYVLDTSTPGRAVLTITASTGLANSAGPLIVGSFTAVVPNNAPYARKHILDIANLRVLDNSPTPAELPVFDDDAIHVAAFFGDANGDGAYNSPDATLTRRIIGLLNTGLAAYQLADPRLIVDISGNGSIQSNDTMGIRRAIGLTSVPNIPALPSGLAKPAAGGVDPRVYIPRDLTGTPGGIVAVPVRLEVTERAGITLSGFEVVIEYDPSHLSVTASQLGELLSGTDVSGSLTSPAPGQLIFTASAMSGTGLLPWGTLGDLFTVTFAIAEQAQAGASVLNLRSGLGSTATAVFDTQLNNLVLSPAPTDSPVDLVDGLLTVQTPAVWPDWPASSWPVVRPTAVDALAPPTSPASFVPGPSPLVLGPLPFRLRPSSVDKILDELAGCRVKSGLHEQKEILDSVFAQWGQQDEDLRLAVT